MNHEVQGQIDQAIEAYRRAVEGDPDLVVSHNNLAMLLLTGERHAEALRHAERAISAAPRRAAFQDTYALALMAAGRTDEAVDAARRAAALQPNNPEFYITLAEALVQADRGEEAREVVARLDQALRDVDTLPEPLSRRLDALHKKLSERPVLPDSQPVDAAMNVR